MKPNALARQHGRKPLAESMSERIFYLWYHPTESRYQMHDCGLHCGECLKALIDGAWVETRIEHSSHISHSHGWFLVTHPNQPLEDLAVRKERR